MVPPVDAEALEALRSAAKDMLDQALAEVGSDASGVDVHATAVEGPAAQLLVEAAADAELLVVGSRGHGASRACCSDRSGSSARTTLPAPL